MQKWREALVNRRFWMPNTLGLIQGQLARKRSKHGERGGKGLGSTGEIGTSWNRSAWGAAVGSTKGNRLTGVEGPAVCSRVGSDGSDGSDDSFGRNRPLASRRRFFESFRPTGIWLHRETFAGLQYPLMACAKILW
jgi:hypothetical protein